MSSFFHLARDKLLNCTKSDTDDTISGYLDSETGYNNFFDALKNAGYSFSEVVQHMSQQVTRMKEMEQKVQHSSGLPLLNQTSSIRTSQHIKQKYKMLPLRRKKK